ncbi:MAG: CarD family transcriptional regulator [Candidatus Omnitrophota bacterium]
MFKMGDTVIHPVHGFCSVKSVAQGAPPDIDGCVFVLKPGKSSPGDFKILLSADEVEKSGIRYPVDKEKILDVLMILKSDPEELTDDSGKRYFALEEKIRSGDIYKIAEVVRDLKRGNNQSVLQKMSSIAQLARGKLVDEISYVRKASLKEANRLIDNALKAKSKKGGSNGK